MTPQKSSVKQSNTLRKKSEKESRGKIRKTLHYRFMLVMKLFVLANLLIKYRDLDA